MQELDFSRQTAQSSEFTAPARAITPILARAYPAIRFFSRALELKPGDPYALNGPGADSFYQIDNRCSPSANYDQGIEFQLLPL